MKEEKIRVRGARVHNLKNISIDIPRDRFIVITGVSGSGKSSLAFDTLFAEGQRRYVESLSAYARQFLGRIKKPDVDSIEGIPPTIAIEQRVNTRNPRSTLGTATEIYDYLCLLFARVGRTYSPVTGKEVKCHSQEDVLQYILSLPPGTYALLLAPFGWEDALRRVEYLLQLQQDGYVRFHDGQEMLRTGDLLGDMDKYASRNVLLLAGRVESRDDPGNRARILESVRSAFTIGQGVLFVSHGEVTEAFSKRFEADGITFMEPTEHLFSFNSPLGACPECGGYGQVTGIDESLVVPDQSLSVYQDAVACWKGEVMSAYKHEVVSNATRAGFPVHKPYNELSTAEKEWLWNGDTRVTGIKPFFKKLETARYKIKNRILISRYIGKTQCPVCGGTRLRKEASYVRVNGRRIDQLLEMNVEDLETFIDGISWDQRELEIAGRTITEISSRLHFLNQVGLGYLTLNRRSSTLSGGESQRVNLVSSLGSSLVGSLYILDEPSIGLHPRDTQRLLSSLLALKDLGNTVLVVEHDEEIMRASDQIIDIGPLAGKDGGRLMYQGPPLQQGQPCDPGESRTLRFLANTHVIPVPGSRLPWNSYIGVEGASHNNLKAIDVKFPLQVFTAVTGVSGSGKSSLVRDILYCALGREYNQGRMPAPGKFRRLTGDLHRIGGVELVDQNPIGKSSRSNPVTYIKAYDDIRKLFSEQPYARMNGYGHSHFSFNIEGGRCPECQGEGVVKVEMQFMADVILTCESCRGKRFLPDILEVRYKDRNIYDILEMTVREAIDFFSSHDEPTARRIAERLMPLDQVGLSYIKLGQSSSSLSGGESQRVKLAYFLSRENSMTNRLFIFDEPTTGLHVYDIEKLLKSFSALISKGHTVLVVEHNMDLVKCADWVIDLGPGAGDEGGSCCYCGTPEGLAQRSDLATGLALRSKIPVQQ
ncbi:MAG TPA: excinuclease ABC subunit UvrA [Bacteroidales bacterium]|nr:excinuclease ABC subunit UvrA [Bacteroidales bacterium]HOR11522.1 excinuclease ABC subunit UvrA [Bacteroidales bacterium]HPB77841.1 excinuclease ABC subunit UvrA [Bacteroidales bacterium]HPK39129.1 excinuclease ABC subunit UvrA [Bacteroidales bacterium]HQN81605.1 excinuclease ABC subunit UvrA [Bacteroidales bacterium]